MPIYKLTDSIPVIIKNILKVLMPIAFVVLIFMQDPAYALDTSTDLSIQTLKTNVIAVMKYEVKEPTSLENPVTDPNFNVMRNKELGKSRAIPLVVGVLIIAIVAPIATWMYFSN